MTTLAPLGTVSFVQPKRPRGAGWSRFEVPRRVRAATRGYPIEGWLHRANRIMVLSAVEVMRDETPPLGPEYHVSVSAMGERCRSWQALWVLAQFGLADAREDNHVPGGKVRNFWRPVADRLSGYECPCVDVEPAMREDQGDFVWRGVAERG